MKTRVIIKKIFNHLIPKNKRYVYVCPHENGGKDKYDLLNYTGDNALSILNYLNNNDITSNSVFFVECFSRERLEIIRNEVKNWSVRVVPILSKDIIEEDSTSIIRTLNNLFIRYRCSMFITCSQHFNLQEKMKCQRNICLGYSTPFKTGLFGEKYLNYYKFLDYYCETSLLTASIHAAQYHNYLADSPIIGYARNDNLFDSPKKENAVRWIENKINKSEDYKVAVYAPTYREDEKKDEDNCILGYSISPEELEEFLESINLYIIVKYHSWRKNHTIGKQTEHVIPYEISYDFTLYDVLSVSDMLISDYSSIIHDYVLTDKPIVHDLYDFESYRDSRGFAFDPIDYICPGRICYSFEETKEAIVYELSHSTRDEKYNTVKTMFHKYQDNRSSERTWDFIKKQMV